MIEFFLQRVRGLWVLTLSLASVGYGWLILAGLPYWSRLNEAQGGSELQTTFFYEANRVRAVLGAFDAKTRHDAFIFYALDLPNAVLFGASFAALMAFGLRHLGLDKTLCRWLLLVPLASGATDLIENALLTALLLLGFQGPDVLGTLAGAATTIKLGTGYASMPIMIILVLGGLGRVGWRRFRPLADVTRSNP
jgi:hypothetical protein